MKTPIGGAFASMNDQIHRLGSMQTIEFPMRRYSESEEIDYLVIGVGSAGGVLLQRLARAGFKVIGMEAGPFWDTERDWVSDEGRLPPALLGRSPTYGREKSAHPRRK